MAKARAITVVSPQESFVRAAEQIVGIRVGEVFEHRHRALDIVDIEGVHDMRVASRRLRAALEIFEPCFEKKAYKKASRDVKRLADDLGGRRDLDVELEFLARRVEEASPADRIGLESLIDVVRSEQAQANDSLETGLKRIEKSSLQRSLAKLTTPGAAQ